MPSLRGLVSTAEGWGNGGGPRKRRGSSDIPLLKLVRRDLAPSQAVTPGVPQGNRSWFPTGRVASNQTTAAGRPRCFVLGFHFLCAQCTGGSPGPTSFLFLLRYFIRRICQARSSSSKRLPGSGCPHRWEYHAPSSHRHRASKRQPNSNSDRLCRRGKKVRVTLWTLMFCFPSLNRPLSSRLLRTVSPEPGRFSASHLGGLLTPWDGSDGYRLVVERLYKTNGIPQSTRGSGKVLIP